MKNLKLFFKNIKSYYKYAVRSAKAELKSEVADSYLNWLWWVIEPLCFMLIYVFVFGYVFKASEEYFATFIFVGLTAWEFFNRMLKGSVKLILQNRDLVTKVYIPKYILLLSKSFTYLFKMLISFGIAFVVMIVTGVPLTLNILYMIPIVIILYILSFGMGMIIMHFGVFLDDLANLINIFLRMLVYFSGVFYNISTRLSGKLAYFLLRGNPIAFIMNELRKTMIYGMHPSFEGLAFWLVIGCILCVIGINIIHKNENSYAKVI